MPSHSILVRRDKITARHVGEEKKSYTHTLTFTVTTSFTHFYTQLYISVKKYLQKTDWDHGLVLVYSQIQSCDTV